MKAVKVILIALLTLVLISCSADITVHSHAPVTNLEIDDTYIGTMESGEERSITVSSTGRVFLSWRYEGSSESDYMRGAEDGRVYHLYASYGSFDEW